MDRKHKTHNGVEGLSFGILSSEEIRKSSVMKVWTPLSFNQYGRPLPGGLYDPKMGSLPEKYVTCVTCNLSSFHCPGHMGYIELPVPVVCPVFRRELLSVIKMTCWKCKRIQIADFAKYLLLARLRLLNLGYSTAAIEADRVVTDHDGSIKTSEAIALWAHGELEKYIDEVVAKGASEESSSTRTYSTLRRLFVDITLHAVESARTCIHCKSSIRKFSLNQCRFISNINRVEVASKFNESVDNVDTKNRRKSEKGGKTVTVTVRADDLREHMRQVWLSDQEILEAVYPVLKRGDMDYPTDLFFIDTIPVTPPITRPVNYVNGLIVEHPMSFTLKQILQDSMMIQSLVKVQRQGDDSISTEAKRLIKQLRGEEMLEKLSNCWDELQSNVDHLLDKDLNKATPNNVCIGVKQIIEKKEGIFRMHMMGKRVNYAARSVITPDPYLNIEEIGIPEEFALKLSYPTPVTPWNVEELRKMVLNGPKVHPGATMVENEDGVVNLISADSLQARQAIANRLLAPAVRPHKAINRQKIVHRHLQNGDIMLLNRQPTLHRPSIMAHRVRVLKGEKTIRLHYANCSSYNADFDGDEMNAHMPQNELARSEGYNLVNVCHQYLVPKSGTPLSGLIQDHVISGVRLTTRGRFFTREEYQQLVYQGLASVPGTIRLLPPAILKPQCLWSGKQVISTLLLNIIPRNKPPLSIESTAKIGVKAWETSAPREWTAGGTQLASNIDMSETEVVIRQGELLVGVLDKKHYGATPYGLVHCVYELYGGRYSAHLLSAFSKLFTVFLQTEGFTLGVADILVMHRADKKRKSFIKQARVIGEEVAREALELPEGTSPEDIRQQMRNLFSKDPAKYRTILDRKYKSSLDKVTNEINKACLPAGLVHKFPNNNLQLMVQSGAKGSTVNTMQISCLLGQIELEGKRPPLMISGKALPSFTPFDPSPRAGGFIEGRFMTGIRPQEFFFHCMAGREGLIDTAVKTSRSGYLQRCLVKHLEGLVVSYDQTVRDSDGSVIQFYYGEDGLDVCKAQFFKPDQVHVLTENAAILRSKYSSQLQQADNQQQLAEAKKEVSRWKKKNQGVAFIRSGAFLAFSREMEESMAGIKPELSRTTGRTDVTDHIIQAWYEMDDKARKRYRKVGRRCPDPVSARFQQDRDYGAVVEKLEALIESQARKGEDEEKLRELLYLKNMTSQCPAGEPVGVLAAQSVGEPSTQMTLNTFHFAGRGDMNVTLGIPRLREVLMMASKHPSTPAMDIPFLPGVTEARAEKLRLRLTKVTVADVLEKISVSEKIDISSSRQYLYKIRFFFLPRSAYKSKYPVSPKKILEYMEDVFFVFLETSIRKKIKLKMVTISSLPEKSSSNKFKSEDDDEGDEVKIKKPIHMGEGHESSDEEQEADDEDATMARNRSRHAENKEYEDPEEDEEEQESDAENFDDEMLVGATEGQLDGDELLDCADKNELVDSDYRTRVQKVRFSNTFVQNYDYDQERGLWCEIVIGMAVDIRKLDMSSMLRDTANKAIIWQVRHINKAFIYHNNKQELMLKVDGINISEMFRHHKLLDLNRLYTNDIHAFASMYGIEAASRVLVKEVQDVFQVYGITVDPRHLLLIADYMTSEGTYRPMNRTGMLNHASPVQQMTFETSLKFLKEAVLGSRKDTIKSPSSCLVTGQPCKVGTGVFDLRLKMTI